nr:MAG TPA: hypothetical protein [Caudoviricetes sp.]
MRGADAPPLRSATAHVFQINQNEDRNENLKLNERNKKVEVSNVPCRWSLE